MWRLIVPEVQGIHRVRSLCGRAAVRLDRDRAASAAVRSHSGLVPVLETGRRQPRLPGERLHQLDDVVVRHRQQDVLGLQIGVDDIPVVEPHGAPQDAAENGQHTLHVQRKALAYSLVTLVDQFEELGAQDLEDHARVQPIRALVDERVDHGCEIPQILWLHGLVDILQQVRLLLDVLRQNRRRHCSADLNGDKIGVLGVRPILVMHQPNGGILAFAQLMDRRVPILTELVALLDVAVTTDPIILPRLAALVVVVVGDMNS
mmetsp:Transcript_5930/g.10936  ORF Transcript_5930/g.10936 Transcript_5930/m.10936 type:complete len:261 (+) Transcript_5930:2033-2815(+)